jgi:hypothetical protein
MYELHSLKRLSRRNYFSSFFSDIFSELRSAARWGLPPWHALSEMFDMMDAGTARACYDKTLNISGLAPNLPSSMR